ncbi:MAG: AMP-binding protein [Actinomycetota bacterium]|nr:AMP-binding protein [Actinomycetota bacterium]
MHLFDVLTEGKRASLHDWDGPTVRSTPWDDVVAEAHRTAAGLRDAGVGPGVRVATILTNSRQAVSGLLGTWLAGGAVASLPIPARAMSMDEYTAQIAALTAHVGAPFLVTDARLLDSLPEELGRRVETRSWESLPVDRSIDAAPPEPDELAFVQYSSGSTSSPKGCMLTAGAIGAQLEMLANMVDALPGGETVAAWLPLSHDMGAFGCLLFTWALDGNLVLSSPERFMFDPRTWMCDCEAFGATLTAGPPSALPVAARTLRTGRISPQGLMLRHCVIGAERIEWSAIRKAGAALEPYGMDERLFMPAYGLAEATLAVCAQPPETFPACRYLDGDALADGEIREVDPELDGGAMPVVSVGRPLDGTEVRMGDDERLSEIHVRSPSLASGYLGDPELTAERFRDGEFATGDLGFVRDGDLYVVGRSDDLLNVAGRNVHARLIEMAVDDLDRVRGGCSTIVDVADDGRGRLVMLLELKDEDAATDELAKRAAAIAASKGGVLLDECVFLPRGALPKTPSGKPQRFRCRQLVATDGLDAIARVRLRRRAGAVARHLT